MKLYTKAFVDTVDKDQITAVASSDIEDRQGERVDVGGWQLDNFIKAPRLLWGHEHKRLPVGRVTNIWVDKTATPKLMFKAEFQTVTKFGRAVKKLFEQGFLNTFSVGFQPIDSEHDEDVKSGLKFTKQELLEISVVNVPANPEALTLAYKSLEADGAVKEAAQIFGNDTVQLISEIEQLKANHNELKEQVDAAVKGLKFLNPHQGRSELAKERAWMLKVIDKATAKELSLHKAGASARRLKVIKQATEKLLVSNKGEL